MKIYWPALFDRAAIISLIHSAVLTEDLTYNRKMDSEPQHTPHCEYTLYMHHSVKMEHITRMPRNLLLPSLYPYFNEVCYICAHWTCRQVKELKDCGCDKGWHKEVTDLCYLWGNSSNVYQAKRTIVLPPMQLSVQRRAFAQTAISHHIYMTNQNRQIQLTDSVKVLRHTRHKTGHFRDVLPRRSVGVVLKKLNLTEQKQTTQEQNNLS